MASLFFSVLRSTLAHAVNNKVTSIPIPINILFFFINITSSNILDSLYCNNICYSIGCQVYLFFYAKDNNFKFLLILLFFNLFSFIRTAFYFITPFINTTKIIYICISKFKQFFCCLTTTISTTTIHQNCVVF